MEIISTHRVPIADLLEKELAPDVIAMLTEAVNEGYSFADVVAALGEQGYTIMIHPVMGEHEAEMSKGTGAHTFENAEDGDNCALCKQPKDNWRHVVRKTGDGSLIAKEVGEKRFTLAPMYVPNTIDAHGEWTDPDELQQAVWEYVKSGDRGIRLQHNRDINAGEWVECMQIPYPMVVPMYKADGSIEEMTYPAGTVFLGVIWEPWAWELVKEGKLSGYSIGGRTDRVLADFPEEDSPDTEEEMELANKAAVATQVLTPITIAEALATALKQVQPVVNVVMPEQKTSRRLERDEYGNIIRIIEE